MCIKYTKFIIYLILSSKKKLNVLSTLSDIFVYLKPNKNLN